MTDSLPVIDHSLPASGQIVRIGQIWYDDASRAQLDPAFTPIHNAELGPWFEAGVIRAAIARGWAVGADLVGFFSWRFGRKIPLTGDDVLERLDAAPGHDVYSFFGVLEPGPIWSLAERKHPGVARAADLLFDRLGLSIDVGGIVGPPVYQHHFVATGAVYTAFVDGLLAPALDAMSRPDDRPLQEALLVDSGYRGSRHRQENLQRLFGTPWLPLHPFVAERLFSTWLALHPELSLHEIWDGRFVEEADVDHEPELRERRA